MHTLDIPSARARIFHNGDWAGDIEGMDALAAGLRSAARRCRRSVAREGTRGRRGARSVGPFGLPWMMYRETMAGVREVYEPVGGAQ